MFSLGQYEFAAVFIIVFIIAMIYSYRKDIFIHRKYYKRNYLVLIVFFIFIGILFVIKRFLKKI